jgi:anti-sigma factor (TIGR02949 family)
MSCGNGITCQEAVTIVQEFLDGVLEDASSERVRAHFEACSRCYPHLRFERSFREALARVGRGDGAPPDLKRRVVDLLAEVGEKDAAGAPGDAG